MSNQIVSPNRSILLTSKTQKYWDQKKFLEVQIVNKKKKNIELVFHLLFLYLFTQIKLKSHLPRTSFLFVLCLKMTL